MNPTVILIPILLPVLAGALMLLRPIENLRRRNVFVETVTLVNTAITLWILTHVSSAALSPAYGLLQVSTPLSTCAMRRG